MSLVAMKYLYDLELIDDQGREDAVAKHTMLAICWSYVDGCEQVTVAYETLRRRVHFSPSAIRAALARLSDEQQGYGLLQIRSRTRGPQAEVVFALNLEKLRELYGAEQLELRMTSLRAVTEETPSGGETLSGETPPGGETQQNNATRWRNSEKDTPPGGETPAEIRHLVAKPGLHEGSHISVSNSLCHSLSRTPLSPPVERERGSPGSRFSLRQWYAWAVAQPDTKNPIARAGHMAADAANDGLMELWLEVRPEARASPATDATPGVEPVPLAEIISGHERRHWQITAALLDRASPAEIEAKAQEILCRAGPLRQWEAVLIEYANNQALKAHTKGIA